MMTPPSSATRATTSCPESRSARTMNCSVWLVCAAWRNAAMVTAPMASASEGSSLRICTTLHLRSSAGVKRRARRVRRYESLAADRTVHCTSAWSEEQHGGWHRRPGRVPDILRYQNVSARRIQTYRSFLAGFLKHDRRRTREQHHQLLAGGVTLPHAPRLGEGEGQHEPALIQLGVFPRSHLFPERFRHRKNIGPPAILEMQVSSEDVIGGIQCCLHGCLTLEVGRVLWRVRPDELSGSGSRQCLQSVHGRLCQLNRHEQVVVMNARHNIATDPSLPECL